MNSTGNGLKRKKGRRPKGMENGNPAFMTNGSALGQPTKRKSRESMFDYFSRLS